jgi:hypothetical protein
MWLEHGVSLWVMGHITIALSAIQVSGQRVDKTE